MTSANRKEMAKSAPARRMSKSSTDKKNLTMKEINGWVCGNQEGDNAPRAAARHVSQLTENVTEERMLHSRQMELGRERYKFLSLHEYEKHKFMERRTLKEKMMKKQMESARRVIDKSCGNDRQKKMLTVHLPQVEYLTGSPDPDGDTARSSDSPPPEKRSPQSGKAQASKLRRAATFHMGDSKPKSQQSVSKTAESIHKYIKTSKARVVFDESVNESRKDEVDGEAKSVKSATSRCSRARDGIYLNTSKDKEKNIDLEIEREKSRLTTAGTRQNIAERRALGVALRSQSTSPDKSVSSRSKSGLIGLNARALCKPSKPTWSEGRSKTYGERFGTSVADPRYVALQNILAPSHELGSKSRISVRDIIAKNEVLNMRAKCESAAHAKQMHAKFVALLLEKEFACQ